MSARDELPALPSWLAALGTYGSESERALYAAIQLRDAEIERLRKEKDTALSGESTPAELTRLRIFAEATRQRHLKIHELIGTVESTKRPDAWDLGMGIGALLEGLSAPMPKTAERRQMLLAVMRAEGGEWTSGRTKQAYRRLGLPHLYRGTFKRDLAALAKAGDLAPHDSPGRRVYTLRSRGESADA